MADILMADISMADISMADILMANMSAIITFKQSIDMFKFVSINLNPISCIFNRVTCHLPDSTGRSVFKARD